MKIAKTNSESEADNYTIIYYFYVEAIQQPIFSVFFYVCLFVCFKSQISDFVRSYCHISFETDIGRIYDGAEAETRKPRASFQII